jgi:glycosyltransferase involved in cell wall biosynthesis
VETHAYSVSCLLAAHGAQVILTSQRKFALNAAWTRELLEAGVTIVAPPALPTRAGPLVGMLLTRASIARRLRSRAFDRVVGHGHGGAYAWMKRFVRPGGLFLWHEHWYGVPTRGDTYTEYRVPTPERFSARMRRMVGRVDGIITGSERSRRNLLEVQKVRVPVRVVPPLDALTSVPTAEDRVYDDTSPLRLIMVGRLGYGKGVAALLDVWPGLSIGNAELHFHGPISEDFLPTLRRYDALPNVYFHGSFEREALPDLLGHSDLALMLSIEEGFGLSTWEYMACGVPFVMTDCGAAAEFTADNPDGLMVPVSSEGIRAGIEEMVRRLRANQLSRPRLQQLHARKFSYHRIAAEHLECLLGPDEYWQQ